jgi:HD-GYP domain-containing protein (c-di-GMP phosphodiesterase class II)
MSAKDREYFHIDRELLGVTEDLIFPFTLYIFNPVSKEYSFFLFANSPLTSDKDKFLEFITSRGGNIAISMSQKRTFLHHVNLKESDIADLREPEVHVLEKAREKNIEKLEVAKEDEETPFAFQEVFNTAASTECYKAIIDRVRSELMTFSVRISPTTSLAIYLAEHLLIEDNLVNRIVAVSYMLAKNSNMNDPEALGDLVVGAYLSHIGQTQLDVFYSHKAQLQMTDEENKQYQRHPVLSHHLIRKSGVELSDRSKYIIFEHHERYDGKGFPSNKIGEHIQPLGLILGAVAHIFEYSTGRVTGNTSPISSIIKNLKDKTLTPGLEFEFGDTIYESIIELLYSNESEEAA